MKETERMIWELYRIGVDALIVQDMGITRLNLQMCIRDSWCTGRYILA